MRVTDYDRFQRELGDELRRDPAGGWDHEGVRWRGVGSYDTGGGYASLVPLVLVRREGNPLIAAIEAAQRARPDHEQEWLRGLINGWRWELRDARIEVYDFGVGVISGVYEVTVPAWLDVADARRTIERLAWLRPDADSGTMSPVAAAYGHVARDAVHAFSRAVGRCARDARQDPWLAPLVDQRLTGDGVVAQVPRLEEWGRLMWLHPVYLLDAGRHASGRRLARVAEPFRATFSQPVTFQHGLFVPGIDTSVVAMRGGPSGGDIPIKLIGLMWAYYALFMEMDRGLLVTLDDDKWRRPDSLRALEQEADRIFELHMRVQEARARLDSALTDLGGGELSLWETMSAVVKFDDLTAAVEGKVDALRQIAERRAQLAAVTRQRRASNILSALTALTIVTVTIAVMTNFIGTRADVIGNAGLRAAIICAAFVLAVLLYREAQREVARDWSTRRWRPRSITPRFLRARSGRPRRWTPSRPRYARRKLPAPDPVGPASASS